MRRVDVGLVRPLAARATLPHPLTRAASQATARRVRRAHPPRRRPSHLSRAGPAQPPHHTPHPTAPRRTTPRRATPDRTTPRRAAPVQRCARPVNRFRRPIYASNRPSALQPPARPAPEFAAPWPCQRAAPASTTARSAPRPVATPHPTTALNALIGVPRCRAVPSHAHPSAAGPLGLSQKVSPSRAGAKKPVKTCRLFANFVSFAGQASASFGSIGASAGAHRQRATSVYTSST